MISWQAGKALAWDATVTSTLADSYIHQSATMAGAATKLATAKKVSKYDDIPASFMFQLVAMETLDPINESAIRFVVKFCIFDPSLQCMPVNSMVNSMLGGYDVIEGRCRHYYLEVCLFLLIVIDL